MSNLEKVSVFTSLVYRQSIVELPALPNDRSLDDKWHQQVSRELGPEPVVFSSPSGSFRFEEGKRIPILADDPALKAPRAPKTEVYTPSGLDAAIDKENKRTFDDLVAQLRAPSGVIPFVGAGMSVDFGFPEWGAFLRETAEFSSNPAAVVSAVNDGKYEDAATLLWKDSPDRFQQEVAGRFARHIHADELEGKAVSLLPLLANGPVITTNFDNVLEAAYAARDMPFGDGNVVPGPQPDRVVRALHKNERVLLKLHGDSRDRTFRTFTGIEYERTYSGTDALLSTVTTLAWIMFTNRPLLFLGCSLDRDRTVEVLARIKSVLLSLAHYAILACPWRVDKLRERRKQLDQVGVRPLWFPPGKYERIQGFLTELIQESSTQRWQPFRVETRINYSPASSAAVFTNVRDRLKDAPRADVPDHTLRAIARKIISGKAAFLLGSYAHLGRYPFGTDFYGHLADDFGVAREGLFHSEVAQLVADLKGRDELWEEMKRQLSTPINPSSVYLGLSALPAFLREREYGKASPFWFITTNYDTMLERTLTERCEPFQLLYYQSQGEFEGTFLHITAEGDIRVIERPDNVWQLPPDEHVVIKLDGGIAWDKRIKEGASITPVDFQTSAGRLPAALPAAVREVLRSRSLLILGSSLSEPNVQRLVRWCRQGQRGESWAIQKPRPDEPHGGRLQFWKSAGVEILEVDLAAFVASLFDTLWVETGQ